MFGPDRIGVEHIQLHLADRVDGFPDIQEYNWMATETLNLNEAEIQADLKAVLASLGDGKPLDPETMQRIRERAERITEEIRQEHGILNLAVELIREIRDEA